MHREQEEEEERIAEERRRKAAEEKRAREAARAKQQEERAKMLKFEQDRQKQIQEQVCNSENAIVCLFTQVCLYSSWPRHKKQPALQKRKLAPRPRRTYAIGQQNICTCVCMLM